MPGFFRLKTFEKHEAAIWNLSWSSYGEFLVSCGADGKICLWGLISHLNHKGLKKKEIVERFYFSRWSILCKFKSTSVFRSYRNINWLSGFNNFCIGSFSGVIHLCKILFFKNKKSIFLKKQNSLHGSSGEIKSCDYSQDGTFICTATRNKIVWIWEKQIDHIYNCFFILKQHESDIKCSKWYPKDKFLVTSSYEGIVRFFTKKKRGVFFNGSISLLKSTIWLINFNKTGNQFLFCSNRGELGVFNKKTSKRENKFYTFLISDSCISFFAYSNITSAVLASGNDNCMNILINWKFWVYEKNFQFLYGGISGSVRLTIQISLKYPHIGNINCIIWHPKDDNILALCSDDMLISIWYYTQSKISNINFTKFKKNQISDLLQNKL